VSRDLFFSSKAVSPSMTLQHCVSKNAPPYCDDNFCCSAVGSITNLGRTETSIKPELRRQKCSFAETWHIIWKKLTTWDPIQISCMRLWSWLWYNTKLKSRILLPSIKWLDNNTKLVERQWCLGFYGTWCSDCVAFLCWHTGFKISH